MTINEIMAIAPSSKGVFQKYSLDQPHVCHMNFEEACAQCAVNPREVKSELKKIHKAEKRLTEPMDQVIRKILNHHRDVKEIMTCIGTVMPIAVATEKIYRYELLAIKTKFEMLQEQLEVHLYKEEKVLFPEFMVLWNKLSNGMADHYAPSFLLTYPIESLESEHESAKSILTEIRQLGRYYRVLQNTSESYQQVCKHLAALEKKLHKLIHTESTLLFPEALALENDFYNNPSTNYL